MKKYTGGSKHKWKSIVSFVYYPNSWVDGKKNEVKSNKVVNHQPKKKYF